MGARLLCATVAMCLVASTGSAQTGLRSASLPDTQLTSDIRPERPDLFVARPGTYAPRYDRLSRQRLHFPGGGYSDPFIGSNEWRLPHSSVRKGAKAQPNGYLRLFVQPGTTEVHIDGFYRGSADDFRRSGGTLESGPHSVELRAPAQDVVAFNVQIAPYQTITYRNDLDTYEPAKAGPQNQSAAAAPAAPPAQPKTFYVIPGCYAGDKPPSGDRLPPACDVTKLRTVPPAVSSIALAR